LSITMAQYPNGKAANSPRKLLRIAALALLNLNS
jgi:hypothetical protein